MRDYTECQTYVTHLLAEHRRLHALLRQVQATIVHSGSPDRDASPADVVATLRKVRSELEAHFAEEDSGGCLEEAVSRVPRLAAEAERIEAEHPELLFELDRLIAQAQEGGQSIESRLAIEKMFDDLCRQLHAHEAAENALLRQGFGANVNGDENSPADLIQDF
jgi:iron-sulfur cluster repair protein YtfE (RIC family)